MADYIFDKIDQGLMAGTGLSVDRLPTFYPSAASCIDEVNNEKVLGSCIRQQYYRCIKTPESDPSGLYSQYIFAAGNMWEDFLIEQFKRNGLWLGNNIKFAIVDKYISGEIDILIKNPEGEKGIAVVESKTYSSSNYQAKKEICGARNQLPAPKPQNVLQAFIYNNYMADQIDCVYLTYLDRSCGGPENNKTFKITVHQDTDGRHRPMISSYDANGLPFSYVEKRISIEGIYERYESLMNHLQSGTLPDGDFEHVFSEEKVRLLWEEGEIAKTKYEKWQANSALNPIGNWECSYCSYNRVCKAQKDIDGHN